MAQLSSNLLLAAFFIYLLATVVFAASIKDKKGETKENKWGKAGFIITLVGFISQVGYFITRWIASQHAPVSNLFEFTTFFGMMMVFAFLIIYLIYRNNILGVFTLPVVVIIIAYASMFPTEISPLIPSLQSHWLYIHVTTAALGQAILAVSFAAGLVYLVRVIDQSRASKHTFWLEFVMFTLITAVGFVVATYGFRAVGYEAIFQTVDENGQQSEMVYEMPAISGPYNGELMSEGAFAPLFKVPSWMNGSKLNTVIWSVIAGLILYGLVRLVLRRRIAAAIQPFLKNVNSSLVDEISYRAVSIGFPVFTLGGLIFAMIWAQQAWTRFWGWDPKEVWALITFLFYAAYLHLRLSRGWHGEKSAWLCVIGFVIIMFNLIFVNLVIAGLHSYA